MSGGLSIQHMATDPTGSAWVSANAGSGKTYVLTRRVIRLMLAGCDPARILCLTFTKAAAAEMANRVFKLLGEWAVMPEADLARTLADIEGAEPDPARIASARRLFARALETPGGLKIQTIHGFCEALLQRFPVEADLPGRFEVLDDRRSLALRAEARATAIREAAADPEGPLGAALALLLARTTDGTVDDVINGFIRNRRPFLDFVRGYPSLDDALQGMAAVLGVPPGVGRDELIASCSASPDFGVDVVNDLLAVLDGASGSMQALADKLRAALAEPDSKRRAGLWRAIFLTDNAPRAASRVVTNAVEAALPGCRARFTAEAERVLQVERTLAACDTAEMTAAAARIADRVLGHFQALKRAAGALDFDDLIQRCGDLLSRSDAAAWVHYKLDEGLDHVLVDEAQDTSAAQWAIVEALTGDFFAGAGARGPAVRTMFAVGDEKQSIYSFQGAEPKRFASSRGDFERKAVSAGATFRPIQLRTSYRSTPEVVRAVDAVFLDPAAHKGLSSDAVAPVHETNRAAAPGLVEVWAEIEAEPTPRPERWEDPVDRTGPGSPDLRLAHRIADEIAGWIRNGERIEATGKRIRPGDILVLVRKRGPFVEAINRELKERRIAVAGADRLDVVGHIVAQDLVAAARVALMPEDDLSLAAFARSPLVPPSAPGAPAGLSEDVLFALAHGRGETSLWDAVRAAAARGDAEALRLEQRVETLLSRADVGDPYRFFAAIVGRDGGRAAFRARIGREADEVIDEFLALALAAEERGAASLAGLLALLGEAEEDVKREVDGARDEVRVMTVHGAKGLEAPVVFLVDPGSPPASSHHDPAVMVLGDQPGAPLVWVRPGLKPAVVDAAIDAHRQSQEDEYRRLLYVGLTRAADRLIVAGVRGGRSKPDGRWYTLVSTALTCDAQAVHGAGGEIERWLWRCQPKREPAAPAADDARPVAPEPLPDFLFRPLAAPVTARALTPSAAAGMLDGDQDAASAPQGAGPDALERARGIEAPAARRGRLIHRLIEVLPELPPEERTARAEAYVARVAADLGPNERAGILYSVAAVLDHPRWSEVFGPAGRAEVSLAGSLEAEDGRAIPVFGQIDRLLVTPERVLIIDFKTGRVVPDRVPAHYATQLALYRALMMKIRPGVAVEAAILWTEAPRLDEVGTGEMDGIVTRLLTQLGSPGAGGRP